jgi:hypothetical protein
MYNSETLKTASNKAYQEIGPNAYFGNGFYAGVDFALKNFDKMEIPISEIEDDVSYLAIVSHPKFGGIKYCIDVVYREEDFWYKAFNHNPSETVVKIICAVPTVDSITGNLVP